MVFAESTQDVADAVALASQFAVPVIAFGVGTSLEGHLLAVQGGISLDVSRMNQVLQINAEDLTVTVQPGVTRKQLNEAVKSAGLFFPIDSGADATLGGMCATRASGNYAGEDGVGLHKMDLLVTEAGSVAIKMMRNFKRPRDPKNILNPGKISSMECRAVARPMPSLSDDLGFDFARVAPSGTAVCLGCRRVTSAATTRWYTTTISCAAPTLPMLAARR